MAKNLKILGFILLVISLVYAQGSAKAFAERPETNTSDKPGCTVSFDAHQFDNKGEFIGKKNLSHFYPIEDFEILKLPTKLKYGFIPSEHIKVARLKRNYRNPQKPQILVNFKVDFFYLDDTLVIRQQFSKKAKQTVHYETTGNTSKQKTKLTSVSEADQGLNTLTLYEFDIDGILQGYFIVECAPIIDLPEHLKKLKI